MNSIVSALGFFRRHTIDRSDLGRKAIRVPHRRNLPVVLSRGEVARLLNAMTSVKHQAASRSPIAPTCAGPRSRR
jgi:integrase/recombinase XerD